MNFGGNYDSLQIQGQSFESEAEELEETNECDGDVEMDIGKTENDLDEHSQV